MRSRYSYMLLFLFASVLIAFLAGVVAVAVGAGVLWIFVYGDNAWPAYASVGLMTTACVISAAILAFLLVLTHRFGKNQEHRGGIRKSQVLFAAAVSIFLPLLVLLHQWEVGNIGNSRVPSNNSSKPTPLRGAA